MSAAHPIIAVTGASGAGTSSVKQIFAEMFRRLQMHPVYIEGDSFHRFGRETMQMQVYPHGQALTHFSPAANDLERLETLFKSYAETGQGEYRYYIHDAQDSARFNQPTGTFTPWQAIEGDSDCLFYEGLHGGLLTPEVNIAQYPDLLIGVAPVMNLEWAQKIKRDCTNRGYSQAAVVEMILQRMPDYIQHIIPQFSRTDINFQRVPLIDTANPFAMPAIPTAAESLCVISFKDPQQADFPHYLTEIKDAYLSNANNMVVPGTQMQRAMEIILTPIIEEMRVKKRENAKSGGKR